MRFRTFSFYRLDTGELLPRTLAMTEDCAAALLPDNTPPGCTAIEGSFDYLSQRVDVSTGGVVEYVPPQPDVDHEWSPKSKRWVLKDGIAAANARRASALVQIRALELRQLRALREIALYSDSTEARRRLADIEAAIVTLRVAATV